MGKERGEITLSAFLGLTNCTLVREQSNIKAFSIITSVFVLNQAKFVGSCQPIMCASEEHECRPVQLRLEKHAEWRELSVALGGFDNRHGLHFFRLFRNGNNFHSCVIEEFLCGFFCFFSCLVCAFELEPR